MLLSTTPPILGITKDEGKSKLGIYKVYGFTKGRTDSIDQNIGFYTSKPKSRKWTITVFSYVVNMAQGVGPSMPEHKGRCHVCISNLAWVGDKLKKNQMHRVKTLCRIYKKHKCKYHLIAYCEICREHQKQ